MFRIGLTGGIGSGKSTVAEVFRELGAVVIDWDDLAREVVLPHTKTFHAIVSHFGDVVVTEEGVLNRDRLGAIIFHDDEARAELNKITHPAIRELAWEKERESGGDIIVHVIPLLVEGGLKSAFDAVLVVDIDPDEQMARLMERNGYSAEEATARINAQIDADERRKAADYVIDNSPSRDDVRQAIEKLWPEFLTRSRHNH